MIDTAKTHDDSLEQILRKPSEELKDFELADAIEMIDKLLRQRSLDVIDKLLEFNPVELSIEGMIALVRTTFAARNILVNWAKFLAEAIQEVSRRGRDPDRVFFGLNGKYERRCIA